MVIKKAVIPAAGLGTRFLPATKSMPKEMLPIIDKPVIHYVVEEAISSGIDDILIITGRGKRSIEDYFDISPELENHLAVKENLDLLQEIKTISSLSDIYYIRQKEPRGLADAILLAEKHVGDNPFAILLGDDIIVGETPAIKQLADLYEQTREPVIGVEKVPTKDLKKYGVAEVTDGSVNKLIEKPLKTTSNLAIVGRYVLTPEIFDCIREIEPGHGGELQLTDAINILLTKRKVQVKEIEGKRYDIGDKSNYVEAIIDFALRRKDLRKNVEDHLKPLR